MAGSLFACIPRPVSLEYHSNMASSLHMATLGHQLAKKHIDGT